MSIPPYHVAAFNTAKASENKIHDDATAQRFGFKGGFVGGVNVYAYMSHQPVQRWGRTWLERGTGEAKFAKPVYDGDIAEVTAVEDADGHGADGAQPGRAVRHRPRGAAGGSAGGAGAGRLSRPWPRAPVAWPPTRLRCKIGDWLGMTPLPVTEAISRPGPAGHPRDRPALCAGGIVHHRNDHALLQLGAEPERYSAGLDPHGQHRCATSASRMSATR